MAKKEGPPRLNPEKGQRARVVEVLHLARISIAVHRYGLPGGYEEGRSGEAGVIFRISNDGDNERWMHAPIVRIVEAVEEAQVKDGSGLFVDVAMPQGKGFNIYLHRWNFMKKSVDLAKAGDLYVLGYSPRDAKISEISLDRRSMRRV